MEWFLIYLFVMVERIGQFFMLGWIPFWIGVAILVISILISAACAGDSNSTFEEIWKGHAFIKLMRRFTYFLIPIGLLIGTLGFIMPSQKDMAIIVGAGITYEAVTSDTGKRLGGKAIELLEAKINAALKDTTEPSSAKQEK